MYVRFFKYFFQGCRIINIKCSTLSWKFTINSVASSSHEVLATTWRKLSSDFLQKKQEFIDIVRENRNNYYCRSWEFKTAFDLSCQWIENMSINNLKLQLQLYCTPILFEKCKHLESVPLHSTQRNKDLGSKVVLLQPSRLVGCFISN